MIAADEQQWIEDAARGSHNAFRCLVERHMKRAYDIAYGFVSDHAAADDITQEAFIRAYRSLPSFRGDSSFETWLFRIVTNLALNRVKQTRRGNSSLDEESVMNIATTWEQEVGLTEHVERALHELPTLQRAVVILRHMDGLSTKEVSRILQCSEGTVKTHLFRGLEKMRQKLAFIKDERA